jgi:copper(I)-binding protein
VTRRPPLTFLPVLALGTLLAGCATAQPTGTAPAATPNLVHTAPGSVTVVAPPGNPDAPALSIVHAALYPGPGGTEELRMTVTDQSAAPEHLYGVGTSHAGTVQLLAAPASPGAAAQPIGGGGFDLEPGVTTVFGPGGQQILLDQPTDLTPGRSITLNLLFAVAGQITLTAPVEP